MAGLPGPSSAAAAAARTDETQVEQMHKFSLDAISRALQQKAAGAASARAAETVYGGHERSLRQTAIALGEGTVLAEHENPGEATVLVLSGRIRLTAGEVTWEGRQGDLLVVPEARHALEAVTAAVILLTVVKLPDRSRSATA